MLLVRSDIVGKVINQERIEEKQQENDKDMLIADLLQQIGDMQLIIADILGGGK